MGARELTIDQVKIEEVEDEVDNAIVHEAAEQLAMIEQAERRQEAAIQGEEAMARDIEADKDEQDDISRRIIENGNREWMEQQAEIAGRVEATVPSTPPNLLRDAGIDAIDPDLLSPRLQRMALATTDEAPAEDPIEEAP